MPEQNTPTSPSIVPERNYFGSGTSLKFSNENENMLFYSLIRFQAYRG
jgi:hypothetical protein